MSDILMNNEIKNIYLPKQLTPAQIKAIEDDGEIIVSAAAGSGKTSTMVKRILRLVLNGESLRDMLILVYNNSAADELREKLHEALFEAARMIDGPQAVVLQKQLDELSFAHISTIHAYCQSLIKENFSSLEISPTFEVIDEDVHDEYMEQALDNIFEMHDEAGDEDFERIVKIFFQRRKEDNLKNTIKKLFAVIDIQSDENLFFDNVKACYDDFENSRFLKIVIDAEHRVFGRAAELLAPFVLLFQDGAKTMPDLAAYRDKVVNAYYTAKRIETSLDFDEICKIAAEFSEPRASKSKNWGEPYYEAADIVKACIDDMKEEFKTLAQYAGKLDFLKEAHEQNGKLIEKLVEIVQDFRDELARLKQEDNVLAFEDLQRKALEFLSKDDAGTKKFKYVFVDEYQDVNPTQEAIINHLIDKNCFMVGDTKQSIYAFRLADPHNFTNRQMRYDDASSPGESIYFNRNFRSAKQILDFVNNIFDVVMTEDVADVDYKNKARFETENVKANGICEMHLFTCKEESGTAKGVYDITLDGGKDDELTAADCEGMFIASKINELVNRSIKEDGKYISYGDITIITRNRSTGAQKIVARLKDAGIPVDDSGFDKFKTQPERELMQMLKCIDNPRQDIPFVGFLLSFFGGYDEQELADIAALQAETFYDKFLIYSERDDALAQKIRDTKAMLNKYRVKASFKNVKDLANGIIADFSYDAYLCKSGEADVYGLKAFVAGITDKDNESLGAFLRGYDETSSKKSAQTKCDRVHLSTIHGYKGLENEVVFVSDLDAAFSSEDIKGDLIVESKGHIAMNYYNFEMSEKSTKTLSKLAVKKLYKQKSLGEEMRLLYVALTRAKRFMYITSSISDNKLKTFGRISSIGMPGSMLDIIGEAIFAQKGKLSFVVHSGDEFRAASGQKQIYVFPAANKELKEKIEKAHAFSYAYTPATKLSMKYSVSALDSLDEQTIFAYGDEDYKNIGTLYHKVMQYIDFETKGVDGVKAEVERLVAERYLTQQEVDEIREVDGDEFERKIAKCLESNIMQTALENEKKGRCMREKAFMMYAPANEVHDDFEATDEVLVQGVIDLFINGDKKIIVDFKNSNLGNKETVKKYKKQLKLYKMAVESAIDAKVDRIVLYSFKTGEPIDIKD